MTDTKELLIPRKLAQQLFHLAQSVDVDTPLRGWVIRGSDGSLQARTDAAQDSERFACFLRLPDGQQRPRADEAIVEGADWLLTLSLDIKGVLQLHAWHCARGLTEVPLRILAT